MWKVWKIYFKIMHSCIRLGSKGTFALSGAASRAPDVGPGSFRRPAGDAHIRRRYVYLSDRVIILPRISIRYSKTTGGGE